MTRSCHVARVPLVILVLAMATIHLGQSVCPICYDGSSPQFPDADASHDGLGKSCVEVASYWPSGLEGIECQSYQKEIQKDCGCPIDPNYQGFCDLCPSNYLYKSLSRLVETADGEIVTCGTLEDRANVDGANCDQYQKLYAEECCSCHLCEDSLLLPDPDWIVWESCLDLKASAVMDAQYGDCQAYQATAGVYCGCTNPLASSQACRICGGSSLLVDSVRFAPNLISSGTFISSCGEAELEANRGVSCSEYQEAYSDWCCAPNCFLCPDGNYKSENLEECREQEANMRLLACISTEPCCSERQSLNSDFCCIVSTSSEFPTTESPMTLPPRTTSPTTSPTMASSESPTADFPGSTPPTTSPTTDPTMTITTLQNDCVLCEDGSEPRFDDPSPYSRVQYASFWMSCAELSMAAAAAAAVKSDNATVECTSYQAAAGLYCGCDNPVAFSNMCRICGENRGLPDPGRYVSSSSVGSSNATSCGQAELQGNKQDADCPTYQEMYAGDCCAEICTLCSEAGGISDDLDEEVSLVCKSQIEALILGIYTVEDEFCTQHKDIWDPICCSGPSGTTLEPVTSPPTSVVSFVPTLTQPDSSNGSNTIHGTARDTCLRLASITLTIGLMIIA